MAKLECWDVEQQIWAIRPLLRARLFPSTWRRDNYNFYAILVCHPSIGLAWLEVRPEAIAPLIFKEWRHGNS